MNRRCTAFLIASALSLAVLLAWRGRQRRRRIEEARNDRAAAAVKGDVQHSKSKRRMTTIHQLVRPNVGQVADGKRVQNRPNQLTSNELPDMKVACVWNTAVITVRLMSKELWGEKIPTAKSCSPSLPEEKWYVAVGCVQTNRRREPLKKLPGRESTGSRPVFPEITPPVAPKERKHRLFYFS